MTDFTKLERNLEIKVRELNGMIARLEAFYNEDESKQFYEQKINQLEIFWKRILGTTEQMMGNEQYATTHDQSFKLIRDKYDDVIIKTQEKMARATTKRSFQLPRLDIPPFDGNYLNWNTFHNLFEEAVNKDTTISGVEKCQLLKTLVKNEACQMIKHLPITQENFEAAWKLLKNRYNNKRRLIESYVKKLLSHPPITTASSQALKELHDNIMECLIALKNLDINTTNADFILNVIILQKLDHESIHQYETSIKQKRELQHFDDLVKFIELRFLTLETTEACAN